MTQGTGSVSKFTVVGSGCIGSYLGGHLLRAGYKVSFLLRESELSKKLYKEVCSEGLTLVNRHPEKEGPGAGLGQIKLTPQDCQEAFTFDAGVALRDVEVVLLGTKRGGEQAGVVGAQLDAHAPPDAVVLSLQNGLGAARELAQHMRVKRGVLETVVNISVIPGADSGTFIQCSPISFILINPTQNPMQAHRTMEALIQSGVPSKCPEDLAPLQAGKLLMNLVNAPNALGGGSLVDFFFSRGLRRVFHLSLLEALLVIKAEGIEPKPDLYSRLPYILTALHYLDPLVNLARYTVETLGILKLPESSHASMWSDLNLRRSPTEIDYLNGYISQLGVKHGIPTPINDALIKLVKEAEDAKAGPPNLSMAAFSEALKCEIY